MASPKYAKLVTKKRIKLSKIANKKYERDKFKIRFSSGVYMEIREVAKAKRITMRECIEYVWKNRYLIFL